MLRNAAHQTAMTHEAKTGKGQGGNASPGFRLRDIGLLGMVLFLALSSWLLPERKWSGFARRFATRRLRRSPDLDQHELATIQVVVGDKPSSWIEKTFRPAWLGHKYLGWMQLLACWRPKRWRPKPQLVGQEHLDAALARGRGVVLFTANFAYQDLMAKAALAGAGYKLSLLARDGHGFSESKLSRWFLNPFYTWIEGRFLHERLVFSGDRTKKVNGLIRARLRDNRPVMVLVTPLGRKVSTLPFLHGQIRIATGALNFACETGAAVLPVFTLQKPDGQFVTVVEPDLEQPLYLPRHETIKAMLQDFVPRLELYVAQYPDQFAFPSSGRHGDALIEPKSPETAKPRAPSPGEAKIAALVRS